MFRGVLFDLDGVLFDSETVFLAAFRETLRGFGYAISDRDYGAMVGLATPLRGPLLRGMLGEDFPMDAFTAAYRARKRAALPCVMPRADALACVRDARARGAVAVATSASRETAWTLLRRLPTVFDVVVTREDAGDAKPSGAIHRMAARGCGGGACVAIEDSATGLRGARAAGVFALLLPDPALPPASGTRALADAVLPRLAALGAFLDGATSADADRSPTMAHFA